MGVVVEKTNSIERIALRPAEAAQALGVCTKTIYTLMERGTLPSFTVAGTRARRIRVSDLKALAGERR
jgi:excisionase family DNA binding protein